jgi:hypothetical protein
MTTRRRVILGGLATACFGSTMARALAGETTGDPVASPMDAPQIPASVRLVLQSDPDFSQLLQAHFPSLATNRRFLRMSRTAVLILNNDSRPIYALKVGWLNYKASDPTDRYNRTFVNRPTLQLKTRQVTAQVPVLNPEDIAVVTPYFSWSTQFLAINGQKNSLSKRRVSRYRHRFPRGRGFVARAQIADSVTAKIKAVVFPDEVAGRKGVKLGDLLRVLRAGESDQAQSIYQGIETSGGKGLADLEVFRSNLFNGIGSTKWRHYEQSRKRWARRMSHLLNVNVEEAWSVLAEVRSISRVGMHS